MESIVNLIFFILSIQILKSDAQWVYDDDGCRTPDGGVGNCVVYTACPSILSYMKQFNRLSETENQFLNKYRCGYSGRAVKMCCPKSIPVPIDKRYDKAALLPYDCGFTNMVQNKIINGNRVLLNEFPWMALLFYSTNKKPGFKCGGTIINERYILTAAHCINNKLLYVRVGEHNVTSNQDCEIDENHELKCALPVLDIKIEKTIRHEKFLESTAQNDIALIRLATPLNIKTENVKAICLPLQNSLATRKATPPLLLVTGWGLTEKDTLSDVLLKAIVPTTSAEECNSVYARYNLYISDKQFCFGGRGSDKSDFCQGDSGGPLQRQENFNDDFRYVQLGVVSIGPKICGYQGIPTINTRVDQYVDWILENIEP